MIHVPTVKSTILLPGAEHASISICINMEVFSRAPLHGVTPSECMVRMLLSMKFGIEKPEIRSESVLTKSLSEWS